MVNGTSLQQEKAHAWYEFITIISIAYCHLCFH